MMPPTSIDGTDITGATIDGTDVQEITVDGQTVFSAGPSNLPVAYSNLVAWYPFDSATYGGSNADDVTAIIGGSGDDTAYDGSVNGATYQSSGGVTDINAGTNSGAFDFDGSNDNITLSGSFTWDTLTVWVNTDFALGQDGSGGGYNVAFSGDTVIGLGFNLTSGQVSGESWGITLPGGGNRAWTDQTFSQNTWVHIAAVLSNNWELYVDAQPVNMVDNTTAGIPNESWYIGYEDANNRASFDGKIEDLRCYNTALSSSQINQIYQNTKP